MFTLISLLISLGTLCAALAALSLPFCLLQVALCKFFPRNPVPFCPPMLSGFGVLEGVRMILEASSWDALGGFLVLFASLVGLIGSGLGWFLWIATMSMRMK